MKLRYCMITIIVMSLLFIIPNVVNAAVEYTREIPSNDGSITLNLTGLTLDESSSYSYALTTKGTKPETWHSLVNFTNNTATVTLSASTTDIVNVLKVTDNGSLYIKNNSDDSYVVNALEVNLKLPYLQAGSYTIDSLYNCYNFKYTLYNYIGTNYYGTNSGSTYTNVQKVTDSTFIQKFIDVKKNNKNITSLESSLPALPTTGYSADKTVDIKNISDGLYIIWVKRSGDNCKDVYSAVIHDGLPEATTVSQYINTLKVESIKVVSPESGTYKTSQTLKIRVNFDDKITGTTVPTLKIKFGESAERSVTNGTIKDDYIEYSYNIQADDVGQLATVSLTGGTIKNASGIDAELSCPLISGYTIKANTEGTTTNNTDNQDKNNNTSNNDNSSNDNSNNNSNGSTGSTNNNSANSNSSNDDTVASGKIPQTGATITFSIVIVGILGVGILAFIKYRRLKGI